MKTLNSFTSGTAYNLAPSVAQNTLDELEDAGYLTERAGHYRVTKAGRKALDDYSAEPLVIPVRNSTTTGAYVPGPWAVRAGADDHLAFKSRGNAV